MALTLSTTALLSALRLSDTTEENVEATRLLAFATQTISDYLGDEYAGASSAILNESAIRISGYLFDMPYAARGAAFANALRNSGAGAMLLPYKVHRGGLVSGASAVAAAQTAIGFSGNPVTDVDYDVATGELVVTFSDGTTQRHTVVSGQTGVDQTARNSAAAAQTTADSATTSASAAQDSADTAQTTADSASQTATTANTTADNAQTEAEANTATLAGLPSIPSVPPVFTTGNTDFISKDKITNATPNQYLAISTIGDIVGVTAPGGGGGEGLTVIGITGLPAGEVHSNVVLPGVRSGTLEKYTLGQIIGLAGSSSGLGGRLNPPPTLARSGEIPVVNAVGDAYGLIADEGFLKPDANGQYRNPIADDVGRVIGDHRNVRIGSRVLDSVAIPTVGRAQYAAAHFLGLGSSNGAFDAVASVGDFIFNTFIYAWYINRGPGDWTGRDARPSRFIGWWYSRAEAESHVRGVGDIYWVQGDHELYIVTAYDPGMAMYSYHWVTPQEIVALRERNELPDGIDNGDAIVWNGADWELGRLPTRNDTFPHVSRIPVATEESAEVLYLDHEYHEGGVRRDVTLRIGSDGNDAGYIDPRLGTTLGSINAQTPVVRIQVLIGSDGSTIERWNTIEFFEEGGANEFDRAFLNNGEYTLGIPFAQSGLWKRRFLTEPSGFQIDTDIQFNLRRALDNSSFHTDGTGTRFDPGLWQKYIVRDGLYAYDHLSGPRIQHSDGVGEPTKQPTRNGEFYVDDLAQTWVGLVDRHILTTPSAVSTHILEFDQYVRAPQTLADLLNGVGVGGFTWVPAIGERELIQALSGTPGDVDEHRNWFDTWTLVAAQHAGGDALNLDAIANRDAVWLGGFHDPESAADEASHIISQADYDVGRRIFYGHAGGGTQGIYRFTTYTQGTVTSRTDGHWIGPFATIADIETIANDVLDDAVKPIANEAAAIADGDRMGVLYIFTGGIRYNGTTYSTGGGGGGGVTRERLLFPSSSYSYQTELDTGVPGGISTLRIAYPTGTDQDFWKGKLKTGFCAEDPDVSSLVIGPMVEARATDGTGMYTSDEKIRLFFTATDITLTINGISLSVNQRNSWFVWLVGV